MNVIEITHPSCRPQNMPCPPRAKLPLNATLSATEISHLLTCRKELRDARAGLIEALVEVDASEREVESELARLGLTS